MFDFKRNLTFSTNMQIYYIKIDVSSTCKKYILYLSYFLFIYLFIFFRLIQQNASILLSLKREHLMKKTLLNSYLTNIVSRSYWYFNK